jgi:Ser/Thr protein kinase RdoA (MazF antagonist)
MRPGHRSVASWTNGSQAEVHLLEDEEGTRTILKCYRAGKTTVMLRELLALRWLGRLAVLPRVLDYDLRGRTLQLSYIAGDRVLEWVLDRFGEPGLDLQAFASSDGLETNPAIDSAFRRFRGSSDPEASALKAAITQTYRQLHRTSFVHGDPSPRNIIYDGGRAFLIDFDHTRPSLAPARIDSRALSRWYGIDMAAAH